MVAVILKMSNVYQHLTDMLFHTSVGQQGLLLGPLHFHLDQWVLLLIASLQSPS